ncbi:MAG: radical SAM protein [Nitrospirae bacterium]|nr:radical SAM protein [Nitrospirota bacterium]
MNISLIKVRESSTDIPEMTPPLGLLYLAGYLRKFRPGKDDIKLFDLSVQSDNFVMDNMKDADIVGLSSMNRDGLYLSEIVKRVREVNQRCVLVLGGPVVSSLMEELFDTFDVDYAVAYEGERTFLELVEKIDGSQMPFEEIKGILFKKGADSVFTGRRESIEDLDGEIPFPAWDLFINSPLGAEFWKRKSFSFFRVNKKYMGIFSSRGCPYNCIYCHDIFTKKFRAHSAERVVSEMEFLNKQFGIADFEFYDDTFNFDKARARRICDLIIEKRLKVNLYFPNGVRADRLEKDIVEKLAKAGTKVLCFAIETVSERLQKLLRRELKFDNLDSMIQTAVENGIHAEGFFMIGHPTETREEMLKTIDYAARSPLHSAAFSITTPQKGTRLFAEYIGGDAPQKLGEGYYAHSSSISGLGPSEVNRLLSYAFRKVYLRPVRIFRIMRTLPFRLFFSRRFFVQIVKWADVVAGRPYRQELN